MEYRTIDTKFKEIYCKNSIIEETAEDTYVRYQFWKTMNCMALTNVTCLELNMNKAAG